VSRRVAVLVVTYDHAGEIGACLDAVLAQEGVEPEVVVCDNASADATVEVVAARPGVTLLLQDANRGFAAGMNLAFAMSTAELVLLLNPDCVLDPGALAALAHHLDARPRAGMAAAALRNLDGTPQDFARRELGALGALKTLTEVGRRLDERVAGGRWREHRRYGDLWAHAQRAPVAVDCPAAACVLARRELLEPAPFDETFPLFFNDSDLCRRVRAAGWRIEVVPAAGAAHGYGTSVRRVDDARRRAEWVASLVRYGAAWPWPSRVALAGGLLADALAAAALERTGRGRPDTAALWRGTLGGLGLPGGAEPWLSQPASPLRRRRRRRAAAGAGSR
jgi:N-acetylglucosaminyl-diphospho-decaprenol L-rhamnosyltransferase